MNRHFVKTMFSVTGIIFAITSIMTILQLAFPSLLTHLRRNPLALASGEWWRMFTPLVVNADSFGQFVVNMFFLLVVGVTVERRYGGLRLLVFYLAGGLAGEIAGYASWDPYGAGASVGVLGLIGALVVILFRRWGRLNGLVGLSVFGLMPCLIMQATNNIWVIMLVGLFLLVFYQMFFRRRSLLLLERAVLWTCVAGAAILVLLRDNHGVAFFSGVLFALIFPMPKQLRGRFGTRVPSFFQ